MQTVTKADQLINNQNNLKPELSNDSSSNEQKFDALLNSAIENTKEPAIDSNQPNFTPQSKLKEVIPDWAILDYGFDPQNPRKPNMREMIEAIAGKELDDLYKEPDTAWMPIIKKASDILSGVIGANEDTRDWQAIMASDDIIKAAQEETGKMYGPKVDIVSGYDDNGILVSQTAVLKDKQGSILTSLSDDITWIDETLRNFGATATSIPADLNKDTDPQIFDNKLLTLLENFDSNSNVDDIDLHLTTTTVLAEKVSNEISLEELEKL